MRFVERFDDKKQSEILRQTLHYVCYDLRLQEEPELDELVTRLWQQPKTRGVWLVWDSFEELKQVIDVIVSCYKKNDNSAD